jgi:hypothetical protein
MLFSSKEKGSITHYMFLPLVIILTTTTILLQFTSTALRSDLKLGLLEGYAKNNTFLYDFDYPVDTCVRDIQGSSVSSYLGTRQDID